MYFFGSVVVEQYYPQIHKILARFGAHYELENIAVFTLNWSKIT
jgi:hypothetical protein